MTLLRHQVGDVVMIAEGNRKTTGRQDRRWMEVILDAALSGQETNAAFSTIDRLDQPFPANGLG